MANLTLLDVAKLNGNDKTVGLIEENLTFAPELSVFPVVQKAGTSYYTVRRTGLPSVGFRNANGGVTPSKSTFVKQLHECYILAGAVKSLVGQPNPDNDGKPYSTAEAYRMVKGIQGREDVANRRVAVLEGREDRMAEGAEARAQTAEKSQAYRDAMLTLRQQNVSEVNARAVLNGATNMMRNDPTGKLTFPQALAQSKAALEGLGGTIAVPVGPGGKRGATQPQGGEAAPAKPPMSTNAQLQSLANARAAIAKGAPRDKVIQELQARGIDTSGL